VRSFGFGLYVVANSVTSVCRSVFDIVYASFSAVRGLSGATSAYTQRTRGQRV
jgi:hypothetical protein